MHGRSDATDTKTCPGAMPLGQQVLGIVLAAAFIVVSVLGPQWADARRARLEAFAGDRLAVFHSVLLPRDLPSGGVVKAATKFGGDGGPLPSPVAPVAPVMGSGKVAGGFVVRAAPTDRPTSIWPRAPPPHASTTAPL